MPTQKRRIRSFTGAINLFTSFPTAAQQPGPQAKQGSISDDDFIKLHQQIKELKNPTFRAFLRIQLLSWQAPHQAELWTPNALWLYEGFAKQIKTLRSAEETALKICILKTQTNNSVKDFSSGIRMLSNRETSAAELNLAKSAILGGQVSPDLPTQCWANYSALSGAYSSQE